jgi:tRNA A37 threonylcarbamoyladenosine synthetase subunit TsaC/SUA5/YrdC
MDKNKIYLVQTDTTVGLLSNDINKLSKIKKRSQSQKILQTLDSFATLKNNTRIPNIHKRLVRNSKLITFIYPNKESFRVVNHSSEHYNFLNKFGKLYSTSANETKKKFVFEFVKNKVDIIVFNKKEFEENNGSSIIKISNLKKKKIR